MRERAVDSELVLLRWSEKQMLGVGKGTGQRAEELGGQGSLAPSHKNERKPEQQSVQRDQVESHFVVLIERFVVADRVNQEVRDECRRDCFPAAPEHHGAACPHSSMNKRDHLSASITDRLSRITGGTTLRLQVRGRRLIARTYVSPGAFMGAAPASLNESGR